MGEPYNDWDDYEERVSMRDLAETKKKYDSAGACYEELIKLLYGKDPINPESLANILEDLAVDLEVDSKLMKHLPTVQRAGQEPPMLYSVSRDLI
jgi:hypothetical protein